MKRIKSERGQSLVELGISILILLYLLSGAAEFGVLFFQFVQLRDAAQEGALYASSNIPTKSPPSTTWDAIETRAREASDKPVDLADTSTVDVYIYVIDSATSTSTLVWKNRATQGTTNIACESNGVQVTVEYDHKIFMPFMGAILNQSHIPLKATVTDTILAPVCT